MNMESKKENIGNRLKQARLMANKTQKEMADIAQTTENNYGHYERGRQVIPHNRAFRVCDELKINFPWLMFGVGERDRDRDEEALNDSKEVQNYIAMLKQLSPEQKIAVKALMQTFLDQVN